MANVTVTPNVQPPLIFMVATLAAVAREFPEVEEIVIRHGMDGVHGEHSLHYALRALDIRTKNLPDLPAKKRLQQRMIEELGPAYDVILEDVGSPNEHLHIELDP